MASLTDDAAVRRLADRFGFGLAPDRLAAAQADGFGETLTAYLRPSGADAGVAATPVPKLPYLTKPRTKKGEQRDQAATKAWRKQLGEQQDTLLVWWLDRMVRADHPLAERMTWFWHGHFATSVQKVKIPALMLQQNQTMRSHGLSSFTDLAQAMIIDPALLIWLDGNDNTAKAPNENLAREYLELFSLGQGHYTEDDVKAVARALTGWAVDRETGHAVLRKKQHDAGATSIFGTSGEFDAESLVRLVLQQPDSAPFVIGRIWFRLVSTTPPDRATLARLLSAYGPGRDLRAVLRAIAAEPVFRDSTTTMVKQPVEWLVGLLRALGVRPGELEPQPRRQLAASLRGMGQLPFRPPSVGGWPAGAGWLTTGAALARIQAAQLVAAQADLGEAKTTPARQRVEYVRRLLGVDRFSARTADAISQVASQLPTAIAVAACSPEYTVSG